jgi:hypothetical protein
MTRPHRQYRANCILCQYVGPERSALEVAIADQERHAGSRAHALKVIERDRGDLLDSLEAAA